MEPSKRIAVCFAADERYVQHALVAMVSFSLHNQKGYDLFLFTDTLSTDTERLISTTLKRYRFKNHVGIRFVSKEDVSVFTGHISRLPSETYYRLLMADLLPLYHWGIYIDADTVCLKKLAINVEAESDFMIQACLDYFSAEYAKERDLASYFNAGFMVINLEAWRKENVFEKLITLAPKKMTYADQEVLNVYFENRWKALPMIYNMPASFVSLAKVVAGNNEAVIVHYVGHLKPWDYFRASSVFYWYYRINISGSFPFFPILKSMFNSAVYLLSRIKI